MNIDFDLIVRSLPLYLKGALVSLEISGLAIIGATILGYFIALMRMSSVRVFRGFAEIYVWVFRGTPLMLILFFMYYGCPFGIRLTAFQAGLFSMILNSSSFKSEIIRAGLLAVDKKQLEAADSVGMNPIQRMFRVTLPQMIRIIIPPYINNCVIMLKESSQVSVITVQDLMMVLNRTYNSTYRVAETLGVGAIMYLIMTSILMLLQKIAEQRLKTERKQ